VGVVQEQVFVVSFIGMSRIAVIVVASLGAIASAAAAPPPPAHGAKPLHTAPPALSVAPVKVARGAALTVSGRGCAPGDPVTILSAAFPRPAGKALGTIHVAANKAGRFHGRTHVPATTRRGRYPVTARCAGENLNVLAWFRVV